MWSRPRGVRVEWRAGGCRAHIVGLIELRRVLENDPNVALSVLYGFGRWEAGRSRGGARTRSAGAK